MDFVYDDGGRASAGFRGQTGDCVVRSIAIATGKPYREVYDAVNVLAKTVNTVGARKSKSRDGVHRSVYDKYLLSIGWRWVPTMKIGSGCTTHLDAAELPAGRLIVRVSKHMTCVIDGVIHDTFNPSDCGATGRPDASGNLVWTVDRRCVYGYWVPA